MENLGIQDQVFSRGKMNYSNVALEVALHCFCHTLSKKLEFVLIQRDKIDPTFSQYAFVPQILYLETKHAI